MVLRIRTTLPTHQFDAVVLGERGILEHGGADDDGDQLNGYGYDGPFVDYRLQVQVVGQQQRDGDARHQHGGQVHVADVVPDLGEREHHLEHATVPADLDAQQLLHLGRDHVYASAGREAADQRLGQYGAHHAQPEHVHEYLNEADHERDGRGHLDRRVDHGGRHVGLRHRVRGERRVDGRGSRDSGGGRRAEPVLQVAVAVRVDHLARHQAHHRERAHRHVLGRAHQAVYDHR